MQKLCNKIFLCIFGIIMLVVPVISILQPERTTSLYENRNLEVKPVLTKESLLNGDYFSGWDKYYSDHIFARNTLLRIYSAVQLALPRVQVNDVIEGDSGALLNVTSPELFYEETEREHMDKKVQNIQDVAKYVENSGGIFCYVGIPEQRTIYADEYPECMPLFIPKTEYAEKRIFEGLAQTNAVSVNMADVFDKIENPKDYYLSVDTHYNFYGALLTYRTLMEAINSRLETPMKIYSDDELVFYKSDQEVIGAQSRKLCNLQERKEYLVWAELKEPVTFTRMDYGSETEPTLYRKIYAEYAAYGDYMGGDISETIIKTNQTDKPKVLMYGDSFTNPLEMLVYASCSEFRSLDFRHYSEMTLYEYIDMYKPDIVIAVRDNTSYTLDEYNGQYS